MTVLPASPDDRELTRLSAPRRGILSVVRVFAIAAAVWSFTGEAGQRWWMWLLAAPLLLAAGAALTELLAGAGLRRFNALEHLDVVENYAERPSVDILVPTGDEDLLAVANTFASIANVDWDGPLQVYVLDDSGRDDVRNLAEIAGFTYLSRPDRAERDRLGNIRFGLANSSGEIVAIVDADSPPRADLLDQTVAYLDTPGVGAVQAARGYDVTADQGWVERGGSALTEHQWRWAEPVRDRLGATSALGNGSVARRRALEPAVASIRHADDGDKHLAFELRAGGNRVRYVPLMLTKSPSPADQEGYLREQYRLGAEAAGLLTTRRFWSAPTGARARIGFLAGLLNVLSCGLLPFAAPATLLAFIWFTPDSMSWQNVAAFAPLALSALVVTPAWHSGRYGYAALRAAYLRGWAVSWSVADKLRRRAAADRADAKLQLRLRKAVMSTTTLWLAAYAAGVALRGPGNGTVDIGVAVLLAAAILVVAVGALHTPVKEVTYWPLGENELAAALAEFDMQDVAPAPVRPAGPRRPVGATH